MSDRESALDLLLLLFVQQLLAVLFLVALGCVAFVLLWSFPVFALPVTIVLAFLGGLFLPRVDRDGLPLARWLWVGPLVAWVLLTTWGEQLDSGNDGYLLIVVAIACVFAGLATAMYSAGAAACYWLQQREARLTSSGAAATPQSRK